MTNAGIFIDHKTLNALSSELRARLLEELFDVNTSSAPSATDDAADSDTDDEHLLELSIAQARKFLGGCSSKTRKAIATMVAGPSPSFQVADIAKALAIKPAELTGVWSGLTRRSRTISGDEKCYPIRWSQQQKYDKQGIYIDEKGWLTDMTYQSFRKALGL